MLNLDTQMNNNLQIHIHIHLVCFVEQRLLKLLLGGSVGEDFIVVILGQDPRPVVVHDHDPLHAVQGGLQQTST